MQGINNDPRKPRRIELAFLEIELPGAVLLRHQPPLQPVGEPRHHALQVRQLLVEVAAQTVKLVLLTQTLGSDRLVKTRRERPIIRSARLICAVPPPPWL